MSLCDKTNSDEHAQVAAQYPDPSDGELTPQKPKGREFPTWDVRRASQKLFHKNFQHFVEQIQTFFRFLYFLFFFFKLPKARTR